MRQETCHMLHVACHTVRQYQVPQFINIEDKVVGPLTIKQFFYLLGGTGTGVIAYFFMQFFLFIIVMVPVGILTLLFAFLTINGQPFAKIFSSALNFYLKPRLFVWQSLRHETKKVPAGSTGRIIKSGAGSIEIPKPQEGRLSDLAWSLDIKEKNKR